MKLKKVSIENYKSIENLNFEITEINKSYTYTLLGINESGKSSFLKALALYDEDSINFPSDFFDESKDIAVEFTFNLIEDDIKLLKTNFQQEYSFPNELLESLNIESVTIKKTFPPSNTSKGNRIENVKFINSKFSTFTLKDNIVRLKTPEEIASKEAKDFDLKAFMKDFYPSHFWENSPQTVFWTAIPKYLLLDEIDLLSFANNPKEISIPLFNCFQLAGIKEENIRNEIEKLKSPGSIRNLTDKLGDVVTNHIKGVWPQHPINIKFEINNNKLSFLIEDNGVKYKIKTINQRSDGFRQFISFLLTISVENKNDELKDTILLLDEPETHLHPQAQINLKEELIKLTINGKNNIVFFATHSNYMIDKDHINRCFIVEKKDNERTSLRNIEKNITSYSEVNFVAFNILTNDFHNELYGFIEDTDSTTLESLPKTLKWENARTGKSEPVSLSKYIRHTIHHPENTKNRPFTDEELRNSIDTLKKIKDGISK